MKFPILLASAFLALAACGGSGVTNIGGGGGDEDTGGGVGGGGAGDGGGTPTAGDTCAGAYVCSGDVLAVTYDSGTDVLTITGTPFDETALAGTYVRAIADINSIPTYVNDDPAAFNDYLAYHATSAGGEISVGAIGVEGYRDFGYGGTYLLLTDSGSLPTTGLTEFTGNVAGIVVYDGASGLDTSSGVVLLQVDFTDSRIKGAITGRTHTGSGTMPTSLVLNDATIQNGSFSGTVSSYDGANEVETGTYGGSFAGGDDYIGGFYQAINDDYDTDITSQDTGVFIAGNCDGFCP